MKRILHQDSLIGNIQRDRGQSNQSEVASMTLLMKDDGEATWNVGRAGKGKYESQRTKIHNGCMPRTLGDSPTLSNDGSSVVLQEQDQERGCFSRNIWRPVYDTVGLSLECNNS